jgi:hypothetical protein
MPELGSARSREKTSPFVGAPLGPSNRARMVDGNLSTIEVSYRGVSARSGN